MGMRDIGAHPRAWLRIILFLIGALFIFGGFLSPVVDRPFDQKERVGVPGRADPRNTDAIKRVRVVWRTGNWSVFLKISGVVVGGTFVYLATRKYQNVDRRWMKRWRERRAAYRRRFPG